GRALALLGRKAMLAINAEEMPIHHSFAFGQRWAPVLRWLVPFGVLFPFAMLGAWLGWRRHPGVGLLFGCALAYAAGLALFFVTDRYRVVLLCPLAPLAAVGMVELGRRWRARGWPGVAPGLAVLLVAFGLSHVTLTPPGFTERSLAFSYQWMGRVELEQGRPAEAEQYLQQAAELVGDSRGPIAGAAWSGLGRLRELRGDPAGAVERYRRAAAADPGERFARRRLARLAEVAGRIAEAIHWWRELARLQVDPSAAEREVTRLQGLLPVPPPAEDPDSGQGAGP
ncbi:MAG: tetratricopeptide repeat protein, partial [Anaerolineae bacterium]